MKKGFIYTLYKGIVVSTTTTEKNHRGISLLPAVAKLFERVVIGRIKRWIGAKCIYGYVAMLDSAAPQRSRLTRLWDIS